MHVTSFSSFTAVSFNELEYFLIRWKWHRHLKIVIYLRRAFYCLGEVNIDILSVKYMSEHHLVGPISRSH